MDDYLLIVKKAKDTFPVIWKPEPLDNILLTQILSKRNSWNDDVWKEAEYASSKVSMYYI